jgi:hypothetical protein
MPEAIVILLIIIGAFFLAAFALQIFFLLTLSRVLGLCRPHNRTIEPGMVWLNLIPIFNLVWMFITVIRVSDTLRYEFEERGRDRRGEDYAQLLGIAMCISWMIALLPWIVVTIVYWVKIAEFARRLEYDTGADDFEEYDRPRRRSRARDRDRDEEEDDRREERPWDRGR